MWISREKLDALTKRIADLEDGKAPKRVTVRGWRGEYGYSTDDYVGAEIGEAIRLLAEHCGFEFERTPRQEERLVLKKKAK